jgi:monoamine oxidase
VEYGAEFIHGRPPEIWEIVDAAGLTVCEVAENHWRFQDGALVERPDHWPRVERVMRRLEQSMSSGATETPGEAGGKAPGRVGERDQTFQDFIAGGSGQLGEDEQMTLEYVEGFNAARADRISAQSLVDEERASAAVDGDRLFHVLNGYGRVAEWLLAGLDPRRSSLRLNRIVTETRWERGKVEVLTRSPVGQEVQSFVGTHGVITLPLGVLQAPPDSPGAVRFTPELEEKRDSAGRLEMGRVIKVMLRFRERFWEDSQSRVERRGGDFSRFAFLSAPGETFPTWWSSSPVISPALTGWAGGPPADELSHQDERVVIGKAVESLGRVFGLGAGRIETLLEGWRLHDWQSDPFSRGAYSYIPVGGLGAPEELSRPVEDTLYFAGEALDSAGRSGTVHGAIASGRRAAEALLGSLKF